MKNYNGIIHRKSFYDQHVHSDIKRYKEIRKLTTGQGEDYTIGYLLYYDYIKNHYIFQLSKIIRCLSKSN